jgi:hypothetical protein
MEDINYNRFYEIFYRYGSYPRVEVVTETHDITTMGTAIQQIAGHTTIKLNIEFHGRGFDHFIEDLIRLEEIKDEGYLRRHNPTLQRAYEEYQLLLKLSK